MENNNVFLGDKLRLARLLNGQTQPQLGEKAHVSRQFIHQLESGIRSPAEDVLKVFCEVLNVTEDFFYKPLTNEVKFEQCHFRKRKTTPVNLANRVLVFSTIFEQLIEFINEYLDLPEVHFPNKNDIDVFPYTGKLESYSNTEIEKAAEECRKIWGLGFNTPIDKMTRVLENAGVVITQFEGVSAKVDALSLNRKYPIIIRNNAKESICRMRFDLAHECGHFVLHQGIETGDTITESEADRFASAFLFPRAAFVSEFTIQKGGRLNWDVIYALKIRWGMSARAIIYRAHQLDLITAQQYRSANINLSSGQSKVEKHDEDISPEEPELLKNSLELLKNHLGISFSYIAKYLGITEKMLSEITGIIPQDELYLKNVSPLPFYRQERA